jgi:hypothetical protein
VTGFRRSKVDVLSVWYVVSPIMSVTVRVVIDRA